MPAGNELEELLERFVHSLVRDVEALPEAGAPFGQVRLSGAEQLARYEQLREDLGYWTRALEERGLDDVLRYAQAMERRRAPGAVEGGASDEQA